MVAIRNRVKASGCLTVVPDIVLALSFGAVSGDCILYDLEVKFGPEPPRTLKQSFHIFDISFRLLAHRRRALSVQAGRLKGIQEPLFGNDPRWAMQDINKRILLLRVPLLGDE